VCAGSRHGRLTGHGAATSDGNWLYVKYTYDLKGTDLRSRLFSAEGCKHEMNCAGFKPGCLVCLEPGPKLCNRVMTIRPNCR
jgi:hypothetical protein